MEKKKATKKAQLSSIIIFESIFSFIENTNFKYKLFVYSKKFQKKFNIDLIDYQEKYIKQSGIDLEKYLYNVSNKNSVTKNDLKQKLMQKNININDDIIKKIILRYFDNSIESLNKKDNKNNYPLFIINILSPLFDIISKSKIFDKFIIQIKTNEIERFNLNKESKFKKINKSKIKYSAIKFLFKDSKDINYLKDFKINFEQIKILIIEEDFISNIKNYDNFFKTLFSFNNFGKNLISLVLYLNNDDNYIDSKVFSNLNNFQSLKKLNIIRFKFNSNLRLKLKNLEELNIHYCWNIILEGGNYNNLKKFILYHNVNIDSKSLLEFPKAEEFRLNPIFNSKINFSNLKNIKNLEMDFLGFSNIKSVFLEKITLYSCKAISLEEEEEIFVKILSFKHLKEVKLIMKNLDFNLINKIPGENNSITKIKLDISEKNEHIDLCPLEDKFPNLKELSIEKSGDQFFYTQTKLEIIENGKCKITKIFLMGRIIKLYIQSYETLEEFKLAGRGIILNDLPFFNNITRILFKSLITFEVNYDGDICFNLINNLYNNIDYMPKLKKFSFICLSPRANEEFIIKFINKILSLNLREITFEIQKENIYKHHGKEEYYSYAELKQMFPNVNIPNNISIYIAKFK